MSLTRSRNGMIAGVASGIARSLNVDPTIIRIGLRCSPSSAAAAC